MSMTSALELSLICLTSSRVHLRNPIAHPLVLRVKSVFARYSLGSLKESPYSLRAFRLLGRNPWLLPQSSGPTRSCGRSTTCSKNEQSHGSFDRGSDISCS